MAHFRLNITGHAQFCSSGPCGCSPEAALRSFRSFEVNMARGLAAATLNRGPVLLQQERPLHAGNGRFFFRSSQWELQSVESAIDRM
jgi:hypothetical protein